MPPVSPLGAASCGEDHNESVLWVFIMNELGTQWTATRAMCDLSNCCHGEAALLSLSWGGAGVNYSYLITSYSDEALVAQCATS